MTGDELRLLAISEPADRAMEIGAYADKEWSAEFLARVMRDDFDAIRAEGLDHAIVNKISMDESLLNELALTEESRTVRGRLEFYLAQNSNGEQLSALRSRMFADADDYDAMWSAASRYVTDRTDHSFAELTSYLHSQGRDTSSMALDLLYGFVEDSREPELCRMLAELRRSPDLKISLDRIDSVLADLGSGESGG